MLRLTSDLMKISNQMNSNIYFGVGVFEHRVKL